MKTVGVFDSGVGGLSVLRALLSELPRTRFVYVADSAHAPYGERAASAVSERTHRITAYLRETHAIDALVLACNTATAHAIDHVRASHPDLPVVGVEPALKPAAALSASGRIGVLATRGTLGSARFAQLLGSQVSAATRPLHFSCQPCDGLADAIERHDATTTLTLCERYLHTLRQQAGPEMDTLVLGCTHYPFAAEVLSRLCGPRITLVDTGAPVARRTREILGESIGAGDAPTTPALIASGSTHALADAAQRWLNVQGTARPLPL